MSFTEYLELLGYKINTESTQYNNKLLTELRQELNAKPKRTNTLQQDFR